MFSPFPNTTDRRDFLKSLAACSSGLLLSPVLAQRAARAAASGPTPPRRFIFFLQNHGFHPVHAEPQGIAVDPEKLDRVEDVPLKAHRLPEAIDPLEPYKDRLTILHGLNGIHVRPTHGGPYGALGGFPKSFTRPAGQTIDCTLGKALPAPFPMLGFGWATTAQMRSNPIAYCSSAWGPGEPAPLYCNPLLSYYELFGAGASGEMRERFLADIDLLDFMKHDAQRVAGQLSGPERDKFEPYRNAFGMVKERRQQLLVMAATLRQHAPAITEKYSKPQFETDLWEASLDQGIAALIAGLTNVVTISSGLCGVGSSFYGMGLTSHGHALGHNKPDTHPNLVKLRRHNMDMLAHMVKRLEAVPEGKGTMMDNTLIVYTSDQAETQHGVGDKWTFLLLGNLGGRIRSGRYVHYPIAQRRSSIKPAQGRSINALYAALLHAAGAPGDHFNLTGNLKDIDKPGPLAEVLT